MRPVGGPERTSSTAPRSVRGAAGLLVAILAVVLIAVPSPGRTQDPSIPAWRSAPRPPAGVTAPPCASPADLIKLDELYGEWQQASQRLQEAIAAADAAYHAMQLAQKDLEIAKLKHDYAERDVKRAERELKYWQEIADLEAQKPSFPYPAHKNPELAQRQAESAQKELASAQAELQKADADLKQAQDNLKAAIDRLGEAQSDGARAYAADQRAAKAFADELRALGAKKCPPPAPGANPPPPATQEKPPPKPNPPPGAGPAAPQPPAPAPTPAPCKTCADLDRQIAANQAKIDNLRRSNGSLSKTRPMTPAIQAAIRDDEQKIAALEKANADLRARKAECEKTCKPPAAATPPPGRTTSALPTPSPTTVGCAASGPPAEVLAAVNALRADPSGYAASLRGGDAAPSIAILRAAMPAPPLACDPRLAAAAQTHAADQGPRGLTGHTGSDGSTPMARMQRAGLFAMIVAEEISVEETTGAGAVRRLAIDATSPLKLHLKDLLNPSFAFVGIACGPNAAYRVMCVIDLASRPVARGGD